MLNPIFWSFSQGSESSAFSGRKEEKHGHMGHIIMLPFHSYIMDWPSPWATRVSRCRAGCSSFQSPRPERGRAWQSKRQSKASGDGWPGGQGRAPAAAFPSPLLQVGVLRLLLPPRRQCCYGDHRYLATKLCCPGHLLSLLPLWGQACVQQPPHLRKRTWWGQAR